MKKLITLVLCLSTVSVFGQFGISYHQSNLPFVGFNWEIADRFMPELRVGTDSYLDNIAVEAVATYQFINKSEYEVYVGLGGRIQNHRRDHLHHEGLVAPIGVHVFPFATKNFGFHAEFCPIIFSDPDSPFVRGSWGIRYRFRR